MKASLFMFGYRRITVESESVLSVLNFLIKNGIEAVIRNGDIVMKERDFKRFEVLAAGKISYRASGILGLPGIIKRLFFGYGRICGICAAVILNVILCLPVWDIRIEGNESLSDGYVERALSDAGFRVGSIWFLQNKNDIEAEVLDKCSDIAWLTINRRGTVAYVELAEKEQREQEQQPASPRNIVADRDCVIEEITVKSGEAVVKPGDIVRKGDVLISGIYETEGSTVITAAEGIVIGRCARDISIFVPRSETRIENKDERLASLQLKIFDFNLNIFKKYRNSEETCDIIEDEKEFVIFEKYKLPISIKHTYEISESLSAVEYSDSEIVAVASERMRSMLVTLLGECDLVKMKTDSGFLDDGYFMHTYVVYSADVGAQQQFEAE